MNIENIPIQNSFNWKKHKKEDEKKCVIVYIRQNLKIAFSVILFMFSA